MRMCSNSYSKVWASFPDPGGRKVAGSAKGPSRRAEPARSPSPLSIDAVSSRCDTPSGKARVTLTAPVKHRKAVLPVEEALVIEANNPSSWPQAHIRDAEHHPSTVHRGSVVRGKRGRKREIVTKAAPILMPQKVEGKVHSDIHVRLEGSDDDRPSADESPPEHPSVDQSQDSMRQERDLPLAPVHAVRVSVSHRSPAAPEDGTPSPPRKGGSVRGSVLRVGALAFQDPAPD